jgi:hypothetical protein
LVSLTMHATRARSSLVQADLRRPLSFERDHLAAHLQRAIAAAIVAVAILVGLLVVRELRFAPSFATAGESPSSTDVPREAVSVPSLVLAAGRQVRVGEPRAAAIAQLQPLTLLKSAEEQGPLGAREVRSYQGVTFVFEPFERAGEPRVAAIYLR